MSTTATIDPKAPKITAEQLQAITLIKGEGHRGNGLCVLTAAAWFAGEEHGDSPSCVSPVVRKLCIGLNDRCPEGPRQRLKALVPVIIGSAFHGDDRKRMYMAADWAVRTVAPLALEAAKKSELAERMRAVAEIVDPATALKARDVGREVQKAAADAAYAATYAAYAAAAAAADAADAAYADAYAAYAAYAAAAASERMWNTILDSAIPLVERMCAA